MSRYVTALAVSSSVPVTKVTVLTAAADQMSERVGAVPAPVNVMVSVVATVAAVPESVAV